MNSDRGPWNEYPGDEFGEAAKAQLLEEEKKNAEEIDPAFSIITQSPSSVQDTPSLSFPPVLVSGEPSQEVHLMTGIGLNDLDIEKSHSANDADPHSIPISQAEPLEESKQVSEQLASIDLNHI